MVILGIDPGLSGAWATYDLETGSIQVGDMPVSGAGAAAQVEGGLLASLIEAFDVKAAAMELVGAMPKQGVSSMFRFGSATGVALGVVQALRIPLFRVTPQAWKKHFGLIGKDKEASRQLALHRFPTIANMLARKKDNGRAEALLIAVHHAEKVMV